MAMPFDPSADYRKKLVSALGGDSLPVADDPNDITHGSEPGGFAGTTGEVNANPRTPVVSDAPRPAPPASSGGTLGQYGIPLGAVPDKFNNFTGGYNGKYGLLRTVSKYAPTADGLKAAIAEMNANHGTSTGGPSEYQIVGSDKVRDTSNGDLIDLIQNSGSPDAKWWYGSENEYAAAHPNGGTAGGGFNGTGLFGIDPLSQTQAALGNLNNTSPILAALIAKLQGAA